MASILGARGTNATKATSANMWASLSANLNAGEQALIVIACDNTGSAAPNITGLYNGSGTGTATELARVNTAQTTAQAGVNLYVWLVDINSTKPAATQFGLTCDDSTTTKAYVCGIMAVSGWSHTARAVTTSNASGGPALATKQNGDLCIWAVASESNAAPTSSSANGWDLTNLLSGATAGGGAAANTAMLTQMMVADATNPVSVPLTSQTDGGVASITLSPAVAATPVSTSDSSTVSLTESVSIATTDAKAVSDSATVSLSESVQLLKAINVSDAMDVSLTEAASTSSSGGGASYRMYEAASPPTAAATDNAAVTLGVEFYVTQDCDLTEIRWWQPTTGTDRNTSQRQGGVWTASNQFLVASTPFTTPSGDGWQTLTFATPVALTANTRYRAGVYHPNAGYVATGAYFSGGADETNGPLVIPKAANVPAGQGSYNYNAGLAYPGSSFNDSNYWVDVTVATGGGSGPTATPVSDAATVTLSESAAVSGTAGRSETTTVSLSEAISIFSTVGITDTLTASLSEVVSAGIFVTKSVADAVTVSLTEAATSQIVTTLSVSDAMTVSVAESRAIAASSALADALTVSLAESRGIAASSSVSDTITVSLSESRALLVAFSVSDAVAASLSESAAPLVRIAPTDTATISFTESVMAREPSADALVKVWNGTTWVTGTLRVWDGTSWASVTLQRWTGSAWVTI